MFRRKFSFTLAKGTPCIDLPKLVARCALANCRSALRERAEAINCRSALPRRQRKIAFTLAEVLIILAIIGVVAAMTIPTLVANINSKVNARQKQVVTSRLVDGLNQFNIMENGLAKSYNNTYEFLQGLSAHYKMSAICDAEHLTDCLPYSTISYDNSGTEENFNISEIKSKLKFPENFLEPAAFISAGGTPFVVAFSNSCAELSPNSIDPDKKMSAKDGAITPCLAGIYDLNGTRTPNKIATDITAFNGTKVNIIKYIYDDGTIKVISFYPRGTASYVDARSGTELYTKYGISGDGYEQDYWAWGMDKCEKDGGTMPNAEQLAQMASKMYKNNPTIGANEYKSGLQFDSDSALAKALGVDANTSTFYLWSSELHESYDGIAYRRYYYAGISGWTDDARFYSGNGVVCLGK